MPQNDPPSERATHTTSAAVRVVEEALMAPELSDKVDMVVSRNSDGSYRVAASRGAVTFARREADVDPDDVVGSPTFDVVDGHGHNPLAEQDPTLLSSLDEERRARAASNLPPSYPNAFESIAQMFDSPDAPDLFVARTPGYDPVGHGGQHGSLAVLQSRAVLIAAGAGTTSGAPTMGTERTVDVAPTIASILGLEPRPNGRYLAGQDGVVMGHLLDGTHADHVVVILLDGCNNNLLKDVMASGDAPNLAGLAASGSMSAQGMVASLPTATLANHTAEITGRHPGHSGVLHHTWLKRDTGVVPDLLSFGEMFWSSDHLAPGVETIFEVIERQRPGSFTSATFEYCDRGASMSTFAMVRGGDTSGLPDPSEVRHADPMGWTASAEYGFLSQVDHLSLTQTLDVWSQADGNPLPTLSWCSLAVTDGAGHTSGPHGELARMALVDSDKRVGEIIEATERAGVRDRTAFLVISDHGMEQTDPNITGDWHAQLISTGIAYRDIGEGLIYLEGTGSPAR